MLSLIYILVKGITRNRENGRQIFALKTNDEKYLYLKFLSGKILANGRSKQSRNQPTKNKLNFVRLKLIC